MPRSGGIWPLNIHWNTCAVEGRVSTVERTLCCSRIFGNSNLLCSQTWELKTPMQLALCPNIKKNRHKIFICPK
jgi:hypothetical protein